MSKKIQKSLQDYLSKIKKPSPNTQFPLNSISSSKKWILKGCKSPKTLSFAINRDGNDLDHRGTRDNNDDAATLADVDRFLLENFKSLYIKDNYEINGRRGIKVRSEDCEEDDDHHYQVKSPGGNLFESPRFIDPPPDLSGSNRFFVATGFSSSLIEEARNSAVTSNTIMSTSEDMGSTSTSTSTNKTTTTSTANNSNSYGGGDDPSIPNECIAVLKYSPNPYDDFRRSMQEMVEARQKHHSTVDWDFMEELLFSYLTLNDKAAHKFVLSAFADLIVELRRNDRNIPARSRNPNVNVRYSRSRRTRHNSVT